LNGATKKATIKKIPTSSKKVAKDLCPNTKISLKERSQILATHNKFRSELASGRVRTKDNIMPQGADIRKLKWDCELERTAQKWAELCQWRHSDESFRNHKGENLYKVNQNFPVNRIGIFKMAWFETYKIGCGMKTDCIDYSNPLLKHMLYVVCHYDPPGNTLNEPIYEVGKPCSKCKRYPRSKCEKNLCAGGGPAIYCKDFYNNCNTLQQYCHMQNGLTQDFKDNLKKGCNKTCQYCTPI
uniref:ShKT domain-containing protein n=1 Tax=Dracunculus medinensis TaxID=318479 RepID=A0A0N4U5H4_DRAME